MITKQFIDANIKEHQKEDADKHFKEEVVGQPLGKEVSAEKTFDPLEEERKQSKCSDIKPKIEVGNRKKGYKYPNIGITQATYERLSDYKFNNKHNSFTIAINGLLDFVERRDKYGEKK